MNADVAESGTLQHPVATREAWIVQREKLLTREKELTRLRDLIARERRALPWVRIDKNYATSTIAGSPSRARRRQASACSTGTTPA
jgi:predicted dithiol-disulfide oxidoreductase (DUF899 family)